MSETRGMMSVDMKSVRSVNAVVRKTMRCVMAADYNEHTEHDAIATEATKTTSFPSTDRRLRITRSQDAASILENTRLRVETPVERKAARRVAR